MRRGASSSYRVQIRPVCWRQNRNRTASRLRTRIVIQMITTGKGGRQPCEFTSCRHPSFLCNMHVHV